MPPAARQERADAARNRQAILRATEELLAEHRPEEISMERVAAAAGVGKGTVFHRFGSRTGLMRELMLQRVLALHEQVTDGPPPLGPGAPPRDRLLAFLDAVAAVLGRNKRLMAALGHAESTERQGGDRHGSQDAHADRSPGSVYSFWHGHIAGLLAEANPELDADLHAYLIIAAFHSPAVLDLLDAGEADRLARALRRSAAALLDAPGSE
ncbi:TetR/AcrR family transcriptional regulator [Actinacidiphila acididurans]|uniref:TetR/AcrR family transcriptional regulator n=1 Tax=Actinacidiphila acididurans TaxID=2784346 RepID=A0ABS2TRG3_9ACTN|nr:TetR/AcrR family transcriptional regulator [Actinacidiphila acididurans]MBM9504860.1 TetR/AcrR family transcriptional regulator [Actinacidiphila acididurans]